MSAADHLQRVHGWLVDQGWDTLPEDWLDTEEAGPCLAVTDLEQGCPEWQFLRCGIITTSTLNMIMTPKTREYSKGARRLIARLLGEELLGEPYNWGDTSWTDRGHDYEPAAREWYELERGVDVRQVAFLLAEDGKEGGSPDGLVGEDGGVEIKCYGLEHHMGVLTGLDPFPKNMGQVQGLLRLTDREWWDIVAYHPSPKIPNRLERVRRNETYIQQLGDCVERAKHEMDKLRERMEAIGTARVDSSELKQLLKASIEKKAKEAEDALDQDEIADLLVEIVLAKKAGDVDDEFERSVRRNIMAGEWTLVREAREAL